MRPTVAILTFAISGVLATEVEVLSSHGEGHDAVIHAVQLLAQGDGQALDTLDPALAGKPIGVQDPDQPQVIRRWTWAITRALGGLAPGPRHHLDTVLDTWFLRRGGDLAAALDALPSPLAARRVEQEAARAFDRGRFARWRELADLTRSSDPGRSALADRSLEGGIIPLPAAPLPVPAAPVRRSEESPGFAQVPGWLVRRDPLGRTRWQMATEATDEIAWEGDAAARRGPSGLLLFGPNGPALRSPPIPAELRLLGVSGGAAWLVMGTSVWRADAGGSAVRLELGFVPVQAPIAGSDQALWLGRDQIALSRRDQVVAMVRHGLPVAEGWRWGREGNELILQAPDGRAWTLPPLEATLAALAPQDRLLQLDRLGLGVRAARLWRDLASAPAASAAVPEEVADAAMRSLFAAGAAASELEPLATTASRRALLQRWRQGAEPLSGTRPEAAVPGLAADLGLAPDAWSWRLEPSAFAPSGLPRPPAHGSVAGVDEPAEPGPAVGDQGLRFALSRQAHRLIVTASDAGGVRWSRRWSPPGFLQAPATTLERRPPWLVLLAGDSLLRVLDPATGEEVLSLHSPGDLPPAAACWPLAGGSGTVVALLPLGIGSRLRWLGPARLDLDQALPVPARWVVAVPGGGAWVDQGPGRALAITCVERMLTLHAIAVPSAWSEGPPPVATAAGVQHGQSLWRWR